MKRISEVKYVARGHQIAYVPDHIDPELLKRPEEWDTHSIQPGFIFSPADDSLDAYFCRYWRFSHATQLYVPELRTLANSELTPIRCLWSLEPRGFFSAAKVTQALNHIQYGKLKETK
jgi:hypothetical protein